MSSQAKNYPMGHSMFLIAMLMHNTPPKHITVVLKDIEDLTQILNKLPFLANISVVCETKEYPLLNDTTTYYICENHSCLPPTNTLELS